MYVICDQSSVLIVSVFVCVSMSCVVGVCVCVCMQVCNFMISKLRDCVRIWLSNCFNSSKCGGVLVFVSQVSLCM